MLSTIRHGAPSANLPLVIVHGLFGSARNWGVIAKRLSDRGEVVAVDQRNHGASAWTETHRYPEMAADVAEVIAALPGGQVFSLPEGEVTLDGAGMMGSLLLVPGGDLALSEAVVQGADLRLAPGRGVLRGAAKAVGSIRVDESRSHGYRLGLAVQDIAVEGAWATGLGLPERLDEVFLDAQLGLSAPIDRHLGASRPVVARLAVTAARVNWGELRLSAKGEWLADAQGYPAGQIDIRVENWRLLPPVLVAAGVIGAGFAPALTRGLEVMATEGGEPSVLVLPLVAAGGRMSLGPLPLGPAPYWGARSEG